MLIKLNCLKNVTLVAEDLVTLINYPALRSFNLAFKMISGVFCITSVLIILTRVSTKRICLAVWIKSIYGMI